LSKSQRQLQDPFRRYSLLSNLNENSTYVNNNTEYYSASNFVGLEGAATNDDDQAGEKYTELHLIQSSKKRKIN
jgi:hypothetical protein